MNPSRFSKSTSRVRFLAHIGAFVMGISLSDTPVGAETQFSLYKSTDQGASWFEVGQGLSSNARINALGVVGDAVLAGTDRGIRISRDAGAQWEPISKGCGPESRVLCFATRAGRTFAGTRSHGVLSSDDGGMTWESVNNGLTDLYVRSLLAVGTRLYAGTDSQGVFLSENAGASWANRRTGLPDWSQVFDLASSDGTVFAGLYSKGLYRWDANLGTWVKTGAVTPLELVAAGKSLVVGHNPGGVFVTEDQGKTWQDGNAGLPQNAPIWTLAADHAQVWVGTTGKIGFDADEISLFASRDRGKTWARSDAGLPRSSAVVSFVVTGQFILVGIASQTMRSAAPSH